MTIDIAHKVLLFKCARKNVSITNVRVRNFISMCVWIIHTTICHAPWSISYIHAQFLFLNLMNNVMVKNVFIYYSWGLAIRLTFVHCQYSLWSLFTKLFLSKLTSPLNVLLSWAYKSKRFVNTGLCLLQYLIIVRILGTCHKLFNRSH